MEFARLEGYGILEGFHQRGVLGDIVILAADPFGNPDRIIASALDHNTNARGARISQASTVYIGHQFGHHFASALSSLQDASIHLLRQDDYLVPFQGVAVAMPPVNLSV